MPTVLRERGFRIVIYPDDHDPAHVHVYSGGDCAVINLLDFEVRDLDMSQATLRKARVVVINHRAYLLERWENVHGDN